MINFNGVVNMAIKEALKNLDKKDLKKKLIEAGFSPGSIDVAFSRGVIPMRMVPSMERITAISAKFWGFPEDYKPNGDRR